MTAAKASFVAADQTDLSKASGIAPGQPRRLLVQQLPKRYPWELEPSMPRTGCSRGVNIEGSTIRLKLNFVVAVLRIASCRSNLEDLDRCVKSTVGSRIPLRAASYAAC